MNTPNNLQHPSPFYRVTVKALVYDGSNCLLTVKNKNGNWELPGGGWEHDESFADALMREIQEEVGVGVVSIGPVKFVYRGVNHKRGFVTLRLVAPVTLTSHDFQIGDDIQEARFMSRPEFMEADFLANEGEVLEYAGQIWPAVPTTVDKKRLTL